MEIKFSYTIYFPKDISINSIPRYGRSFGVRTLMTRVNEMDLQLNSTFVKSQRFSVHFNNVFNSEY